jgi:hypothetical protein
MRALRVAAVAGIASIVLCALAPSAHADGGAYIELDRTHYLPGSVAVARTYVSVPRDARHLLEDGPFYAFLITGNRWPTEGEPIPPGAIRVGTFEVHNDGGRTYELIADLAIPDVPGDFYSIGFCNDPCTVSGFREQITGFISVVQTEREARLLTEQQRLFRRIHALRREEARGQKTLDALRADFAARERDRAYLADEVNRLNAALARARAATRHRGSLGTWAIAGGGAALVVALVLVAVLASRRRPRRSVVPDTPEAIVDAVTHETKV